MLNLLLIVYICLFVHLFSIAAAGRVAGVRVLEISIGVGPALFKYKKFILKLIPINGYVKFLDSQEHFVSDADLPFAFDQLSLMRKILVILPGCTALLLLAATLNGADAWQDFCTFPTQFVTGALSPFDTAQTLLHAAGRLIQTSSFLSLLGIAAAKLAAGNLLPLVSTNGSQLIIFVAQRLGLVKPYPGPIHKFVAFVSIACWISWTLAIVSVPVLAAYDL
ncbi:site-2 protease family protein [Undibacterium sp. TC4M20W]|uniref:site-2 protease family protein n=1 Tax=Undibacterium sp. TC4M20W TaxID=3413052 RepID=UPI003BF2EFAE